jgi:hypothetical protein
VSDKNSNRIKVNTDKVFEEQAAYSVLQNPIDRIKETVQLIQRVYGTVSSKQKNNRIYIDIE